AAPRAPRPLPFAPPRVVRHQSGARVFALTPPPTVRGGRETGRARRPGEPCRARCPRGVGLARPRTATRPTILTAAAAPPDPRAPGPRCLDVLRNPARAGRPPAARAESTPLRAQTPRPRAALPPCPACARQAPPAAPASGRATA